MTCFKRAFLINMGLFFPCEIRAWSFSWNQRIFLVFYLQLYAVDKGVQESLAFYAVRYQFLYFSGLMKYEDHIIKCGKRLWPSFAKLFRRSIWRIQHAIAVPVHFFRVGFCDARGQQAVGSRHIRNSLRLLVWFMSVSSFVCGTVLS